MELWIFSPMCSLLLFVSHLPYAKLQLESSANLTL